jgi:hypothetical protein
MRSISHQMKAAKFPIHRDLAGFDLASSAVDEALLLALMHEIDHKGLSDLLKPLRAGTNLLARGKRE